MDREDDLPYEKKKDKEQDVLGHSEATQEPIKIMVIEKPVSKDDGFITLMMYALLFINCLILFKLLQRERI